MCTFHIEICILTKWKIWSNKIGRYFPLNEPKNRCDWFNNRILNEYVLFQLAAVAVIVILIVNNALVCASDKDPPISQKQRNNFKRNQTTKNANSRECLCIQTVHTNKRTKNVTPLKRIILINIELDSTSSQRDKYRERERT